MVMNSYSGDEAYQLHPIGYIHRSDGDIHLEILGLLFTHLINDMGNSSLTLCKMQVTLRLLPC